MTPVLRASLLACTAVLAVPLTAGPAAAAPQGVPKGAQKVVVVKIVDGDTVDVRPGRTGPVFRVQLLEVDTPERGRCWFRTSSARTAALLPVGKSAYLLKDRDPKDRYGRHLRYVWGATGTFVNRNLVRFGYGRAVLYKPNDRYIDLMRAEQAKARRDGLRIWSGGCDGTGSTPAPAPTRTPPPEPPSTGTDPRFPTCGAANAAGHGPYRRGTDPEYAWYQDRDGDGLVCER
ncbi:thermonuclease family protein [Planomonospora sp. ID91781]|uniref:thermonuclease family protein n=1 Tax=unclassified Planomonospora TaxID=2643769 RepID=UPI0018C386BD|nr:MULTISPECIES: thermonuclease family protein [unclassified Planomonospora]MBG0820733.1 thermonuclease family protein [Planomonospora sp. ID91781]